MGSLDLSPLWRSSIGFDHLFDLLDSGSRLEPADNYPPYDIERVAEGARDGEGGYRITLAAAGFAPEDLTVTHQPNLLIVEGRRAVQPQGDYLYQGIAMRPFRREFRLADHVTVSGARFAHGLLVIDLVRELPEAMKPRRIAITGSAPMDDADKPAA